jgi:hypothetical protein
MKYIHTVAAAAATLSIVAFATSRASAGDLTVTGSELAPPYGSEFLTIDPTLGTPDEYAAAGAIGLYIQGSSQPLWVFCVDIYHYIYLGGPGSYSLPYKIAPVATDSSGITSGTGNPLSKSQSEEIATLAGIGVAEASLVSPDTDELTEIQGAIWQIEYGGVSSTDAGINLGIAGYVTYAMDHPSTHYDDGLYPDSATGQGFGTSQGFATGLPEPASWAIMIVGMAGIGGIARKRRGAFTAA